MGVDAEDPREDEGFSKGREERLSLKGCDGNLPWLQQLVRV